MLVERFGVGAESIFKKVKSIQIIGCGSSYYSGLVAKYWFEQLSWRLLPGRDCQ